MAARIASVRAVVLADTHRREPGRLPRDVYRALETADVVLHAGDVTAPPVLEELESFAPTYAVLGNNDVGLDNLPETRLVDLAGVRVGMIHDSGPTKGRAARLKRALPDANVVVYGHSHIPVNERTEHGQLLFNPGSPTQRRRQPVATFGVLVLDNGEIAEHQIVRVAS